MSDDRYRIIVDCLLNIIDSVIYDDEKNGVFDEQKREMGTRYLNGFNDGIDYVKVILASADIRSNIDLNTSDTTLEL